MNHQCLAYDDIDVLAKGKLKILRNLEEKARKIELIINQDEKIMNVLMARKTRKMEYKKMETCGIENLEVQITEEGSAREEIKARIVPGVPHIIEK